MRKKIPYLVEEDAICHSCRLQILKLPTNTPNEDNRPECDAGKSTSEKGDVNTETARSTSEEEYVTEDMKEANISNLNRLLVLQSESLVSRPRVFFVTSHSKGSYDGVWDTIKQLATHASLRGTVITTPTELYEGAKSNIEGSLSSFTSSGEQTLREKIA